MINANLGRESYIPRMKIIPSNLRVAGLSRDGEPPDELSFGGEDTQGVPPLALESSAFRETVWAHMDPCKRGRLNLEDFEDRLNALPLETADNVSTLSYSSCSICLIILPP